MCLVEGQSSQAPRNHAGEVGAVEDFFVRACQGVGDSSARRLGLGYPLVQLGELALGQLPPTVDG